MIPLSAWGAGLAIGREECAIDPGRTQGRDGGVVQTRRVIKSRARCGRTESDVCLQDPGGIKEIHRIARGA